ncbi:S-adenosyl-L-methionine:benzoic acid/salicylic acid carboxyl methyltransferase 3-like [Rutidosis leptorrhynchoides]|uniref:S-adenosyl-L-methionine:benzoic acid/salicylic acid carboxyl methyltransferase 3-like n=1 Tax=Rutidosis leptorrhynchoides TaxID=125765 RepID=UPI003A9A40F6
MDMVKMFHMNGGIGDESYSSNSGLQRAGIMKTQGSIEEAISELYKNNPSCTKTIIMADLGCSVGPNTLLVSSIVINAVAKTSLELGLKSPEVQINLNDLPTNDFNTIFTSLPEHQENSTNDHLPLCYFTGVPGSFFNRLFPSKTINFIHSSYGLHWLSKRPELEEINKGSIYLSRTTPESVSRAYYQQFQKDFLGFLKCRSEELVGGGRMILTLLGRTNDDSRDEESYYVWRPLAMALQEMVSEGLVDEEKFDSFNIPLYTPSTNEIKNLVETQGFFRIDRLEHFYVYMETLKTDKFDEAYEDEGIVRALAKSMRAASESLVANHFGEAILDNVFTRYAKRYAKILSCNKEKGRYVSVTVSLIKKE